MIKGSCFTLITVGLISHLVLSQSASADMLIDDFSSGISNWTSHGVYIFDEKAIFNEGYYDEFSSKMFSLELKQPIDVKLGLQELSFDISIGSGGGETDYFDVIVGGSNINIWNTDDGPLSLPLTTITHHIDSLGPQNLRFELRFDFDDNYLPYTLFKLDNVKLTPVPSAVILGSFGLTFSGWLLKRRKML